MGDVVDDVVGFVEDAADVVKTVTAPISDVVDTVVSPIADAVSQIPIVGDVIETAAPFGGMLGTLVGGPVGSAIGGAVGGAFGGEGGGGFDFLDTAIGMFGGELPGPLADIAGNLLDGGSLIDTASSVFGGDIGGIAGGLLGGEGGLDLGGLLGGEGGLGGIAGGLLGGEGGLDLGGIADGLLGGEGMPDLGPFGGMVGQLLGGDGVPDLGAVGGLGGLIKTADSVFGGLGLGNLGSAAEGMMGDVVPGLSGAAGWLDNLPDSLADLGQGGDGVQLPFGLGTLPSIPDIAGPITQGGGGWMDLLQEQAGTIADYMPDGCFGPIEDFEFGDDLPHLPDYDWNFELPPHLVPMVTGESPDTDLDDLVFGLPGVDGESAARDALQQLADAGNLGEALASLSQDDLTTLVTRLVAPATSPVIDEVVETAGATGQALGDLGLSDSMADVIQGTADDFGDDLLTVGADAGLDGLDATVPDAGTTDAIGSDTIGGEAATSDLVPDTQFGADDDFSLGLDSGADGGFVEAEQAPVETFTPEPEPQSDFSQQIDQADAVEESFDSMFDDLGTGQE